MQQKKRHTKVLPKFPYYRSLNDGRIRCALSSPAGYEDARPEIYKGLTKAQFDAIQAQNKILAETPQPVEAEDVAEVEDDSSDFPEPQRVTGLAAAAPSTAGVTFAPDPPPSALPSFPPPPPAS